MLNNKFSVILAERLLKISKVSEDTGISRTTLTNLYYRRSLQISFEVLDKLCAYLGCSVTDIIEYQPDEQENQAERPTDPALGEAAESAQEGLGNDRKTTSRKARHSTQ